MAAAVSRLRRRATPASTLTFWSRGTQGPKRSSPVAHKAPNILALWHTGAYLVALCATGLSGTGLVCRRAKGYWPCVPRGSLVCHAARGCWPCVTHGQNAPGGAVG